MSIRTLLTSLLLTFLFIEAPRAAQADSPPDIAKKVSPSVVLIVTEDAAGQQLSMASGFVIKEGVVATNLHVINGAASGYAKLANDKAKYPIQGVVAFDESHGLVLLAVDKIKATPLPLGDSSKLAVGDEVYAIGNSEGLEGTFSAGIVSAVWKVGENTILQITAPISPGSSGGPVVNGKGEVIGVAVGTLKEVQNLNFVSPSTHLNSLVSGIGAAQPLADLRHDDKVASGAVSQDMWKIIAVNLRKAAENGDTDSMVILGLMHYAGRGVPKDGLEAVNWFRKAAERGNAAGMARLGEAYYLGWGVAQNDREALSWFRKAVDGGNTDAMVYLGEVYGDGRSVPRDDREASNWYRKAAEKGNTEGMRYLAWEYQFGSGVPKDEREALNWYRKAAQKGDTEAMFTLATNYILGLNWTVDEREAEKWCRKAAENGKAEAMLMLANSYAKDNREAEKWYRKAAEEGDTEGMRNLAIMYADGRGVPKDEREAVSLFRKAVEGGNIKAMVGLGNMYADGLGVPKDDIEAYSWFATAAAFGNTDAIKLRDSAEKRLTPEARLLAQQRSQVLFKRLSPKVAEALHMFGEAALEPK